MFILMKNHLKIIKNHVFSEKCCFPKKKKAPAGLHQTEDRAGDAPKPQFSIKSIENQTILAISVETKISQLLRRLFPLGRLTVLFNRHRNRDG